MQTFINRQTLYAWLILSPFLLSFTIFFIYAFLKTFYLSFTHYDLFSNATWSGLSNFVLIFDDGLFLRSLFNTIKYSLFSSLLQISGALFFALLLKSKTKVLNSFRLMFYLPALFSVSSVTIISIYLFQSRFVDSLISTLLQSLLYVISAGGFYWVFITVLRLLGHVFEPLLLVLHIKICRIILFVVTALLTFQWQLYPLMSGAVSIDFLYSQSEFLSLSMPLWGLVLQNIAINIPVFAIFLIASLRDVPAILYDAAKVDGASKWMQLRHVTLPFLAPTLYILFILSVISAVQLFDQILFLGSSVSVESETTLALYIYQKIFPYNSNPLVGVATAASIILALATLILVSYPIFKLTRK